MVTRILSDLAAVPQAEEPQEPTNKSLSPDWQKVLSSRKTPTVYQHGYQTSIPYVETMETIEDRPTVNMVTGSAYTGQWNNIGMAGFGTYRFPHGTLLLLIHSM
jgi:hypothetical protein